MTLPALSTEITSSTCSPLFPRGPHHIHEGLACVQSCVPSSLGWGTAAQGLLKQGAVCKWSGRER